MCSNKIKYHNMKHEFNGIISNILQIINQMYCLWYQNIHILLGFVLISMDVTQLYKSRDIYPVSSFIIQLILYSDIIFSRIPTRFK